jgi:hypothetical protein
MIELNQDFVNDVLNLPYLNSSVNASALYTKFINDYGMSYVDRVILGGRAKKFKWIASSATYTPNNNKDQFLDEITNDTLYFDGGD